MRRGRLGGTSAFSVVWAGQLVSFLGTGMTRFALTIWAWKVTGSATALALVGFFSFGPIVLLSPVAGALVDRWNRKLVMMLSDLAAEGRPGRAGMCVCCAPADRPDDRTGGYAAGRPAGGLCV